MRILELCRARSGLDAAVKLPAVVGCVCAGPVLRSLCWRLRALSRVRQPAWLVRSLFLLQSRSVRLWPRHRRLSMYSEHYRTSVWILPAGLLRQRPHWTIQYAMQCAATKRPLYKTREEGLEGERRGEENVAKEQWEKRRGGKGKEVMVSILQNVIALPYVYNSFVRNFQWVLGRKVATGRKRSCDIMKVSVNCTTFILLQQ